MTNYAIKVGVLITDDSGDRVLLIRESGRKHPPSWNTVKGSREPAESIFDAALRECKEETCAGVELIKSLGTYISESGEKIRMQCNFIARIKPGETAAVPPEDEQVKHDEHISEIRWFTRDELNTLSQDDFYATRTFTLVRDWLDGISYPLESVKMVGM